ncbi:MAG: hypothetical protein ACO3QC_04895 [Phycisphaerales bacterium]
MHATDAVIVPLILSASRWTLGIGDPTPIGWTTFGLYLAAAWLSFEAAIRTRRLDDLAGRSDWRDEAARRGRLRRFWFGTAAFLLRLGLNKQLDLQRLVTEIGRDFAKEGGWYRDRKPVQIALALALLAAGAVATGWVAWTLRDVAARIGVAIAGLLTLFIFVAARVNSLHAIDEAMRAGPLPMKWSLEILGIVLVGANAWRSGRVRRPRG